jgi:hypothetical protein
MAPTNAFIYPVGICAVCSDARPCLFEILADPGERVSVAAA